MSTDLATIHAIPDFPAAQQLARALWGSDPSRRGAAVLIGSGFSVNADLSGEDTPRPPLWADFARGLAERLYPHAPDQAPQDPLRLAEEYRTYLGQAALDEFIRTRIRDDAWRPGSLHQLLLELPWSDVLTTNWDTLLERAARGVSSRLYETVRMPADLAHARSPRIVKLHGSLGTSEHFIVAEEDYRTYPARFAAFVNLARQIFIENELCLLGFSGDDPNFLQWSGWVRDELGGSARRIYLVGAFNLAPAKRKLLEARNVALIDLYPLVQHLDDRTERHAKATRLFLEFLAEAKPTPSHEWRPISYTDYVPQPATSDEWDRRHRDDEYAASVLDQAAERWRADRETYPGWLICPPNRRLEIRLATDAVVGPNESRLAKLTPERRARVLYELAWRYRTALWPVDDHLAELLATIADPVEACGLAKREQLEVAALLLRRARVAGQDDVFDRWASVLEAHAEPGTDLRAEAAYQRALLARDRLDFPNLINGAEHILTGRDPVWRLRMAALHCERGDFTESRRLIGEALKELEERQRDDRRSLWIRSRRAWAFWLGRAARLDSLDRDVERSWPLEFREARSDPWEEIQGVRNDLQEALRKRAEDEVTVVPAFRPGHYRDRSKTVRFQSATVVNPHDTLSALAEIAGLPIRMDYVDLISASTRDGLDLVYDPDDASLEWYRQLLRAATNHSDPQINRYIGRISIARLSEAVVQALCETAKAGVAYWRKRIRRSGQDRFDGFAVERLRLFIEVLARLAIRQDSVSARASFALAMDIAADPDLSHFWLFEPIGHLAANAVGAIPPSERCEIVLDALRFPLASEKRADRSVGRPEPTAWLKSTVPIRPTNDPAWAARVNQLLNAMGDDQPSRAEAAIRLTYLADHNALTPTESEAYGRALWAVTDGQEPPLPAGTDLLAHMFVVLPVPPGIDAEANVRARLFGGAGPTFGEDLLLSITAAALRRDCPLFPERDQALRMFDSLTSWRAPKVDRMSFASVLSSPDVDRKKQFVGRVLATAVAPALAPEDRTQERLAALLSLIDEGHVGAALGALPYFARLSGEDIGNAPVIQLIRRGLISTRSDEVAGAAGAIDRWIMLSREGTASTIPRELVDQVLLAVETRKGDPHLLLWCAGRLLEAGCTGTADQQRLASALGDLLFETDYRRVLPESAQAITLSLVRVQCVRLATRLRDKGEIGPEINNWIEAAQSDPLPEVRFAPQSSDNP